MKRFIISIAALLAMLVCNFASACPMCKDSIPNAEGVDAAHSGSLPGGFNTSVYILLTGLIGTIGLATLGLIKGVQSTNARIASGGSTLPQNSRGFAVQPSDSSPDETA
jgi:hypothetical protein